MTLCNSSNLGFKFPSTSRKSKTENEKQRHQRCDGGDKASELQRTKKTAKQLSVLSWIERASILS